MIDFRNLVKFFIGGRAAAKKCEACGREFMCGASLKGCWCAEIETTPEARAELRKKYKACLCRDCLAAAGRDATKRVSTP
jgi:hypothetical protein